MAYLCQAVYTVNHISLNAQILSAKLLTSPTMHGAAESCNGAGAVRPPVKSADDDRGMPTCAGCDRRIGDQYLLRVAPDLEWHAACLKCVDCGQPLDETCTCFVRDGKTYCRRDYMRFDSSTA